MNTLKLEAYNIIKERIVQCEYPPNFMLNEERLKEELKISRTPIRDALGRLEQESLIQILPRRGVMVKGISPEEVEQIYEMRLLIEPHALKKHGETISREKYKELEDFFSRNCEGIQNDLIHKKDDEFHYLFINATENAYFIGVYKFAYIQNIRLRILSGSLNKDRINNSQKEHLRIIRWCLRRNWEKAAGLLNEHLLNSKEASYNSINNLKHLLRR